MGVSAAIAALSVILQVVRMSGAFGGGGQRPPPTPASPLGGPDPAEAAQRGARLAATGGMTQEFQPPSAVTPSFYAGLGTPPPGAAENPALGALGDVQHLIQQGGGG